MPGSRVAARRSLVAFAVAAVFVMSFGGLYAAFAGVGPVGSYVDNGCNTTGGTFTQGTAVFVYYSYPSDAVTGSLYVVSGTSTATNYILLVSDAETCATFSPATTGTYSALFVLTELSTIGSVTVTTVMVTTTASAVFQVIPTSTTSTSSGTTTTTTTATPPALIPHGAAPPVIFFSTFGGVNASGYLVVLSGSRVTYNVPGINQTLLDQEAAAGNFALLPDMVSTCLTHAAGQSLVRVSGFFSSTWGGASTNSTEFTFSGYQSFLTSDSGWPAIPACAS